MQTLKNKAFHVSIQWNALVRKLLALERGGFTDLIHALHKRAKRHQFLIAVVKEMRVLLDSP